MSLGIAWGGGRTRPDRSAIKIKHYSFVIPALLGGHQADPRKNRIRRRHFLNHPQGDRGCGCLPDLPPMGVGIEPIVADRDLGALLVSRSLALLGVRGNRRFRLFKKPNIRFITESAISLLASELVDYALLNKLLNQLVGRWIARACN